MLQPPLQPCPLLPASEAGKNPRNGLFLCRQVGAFLASSAVLVLVWFSLGGSSSGRGMWGIRLDDPRGRLCP